MKHVGSILKKARLEKALSLEEVSTATRMHIRFLAALEEGDYDAFSSLVHLKGFLKNYAGFLGLKSDEVLAFWRREFDQAQWGKGHRSGSLKALRVPRAWITPTTIIAGGIIIGSLAFFGYLFWQYRSLAGPPKLVITSPADNIRLEEALVEVWGSTDPDAELKINDQAVEIESDGSFFVPLTLSIGANVVSFSAENRLGRLSEVIRTVFVVPPLLGETAGPVGASSSATPREEKPAEMRLRVEVGPNSAWVSVTGEGGDLFEGVMLPGARREFRVEGSLTVRSGNAGSTRVLVNDKDLGVLGEENQVAEREFSP